MANLVEVCGLDEITEDRAFGFEADGLRLAIFRQGESVFALSARCPHAAGPLDRGWVEEGEAVCPLHRWRFRLPDGRCTTVRGNTLRTFPSLVRDGRVFVEVPA